MKKKISKYVPLFYILNGAIAIIWPQVIENHSAVTLYLLSSVAIVWMLCHWADKREKKHINDRIQENDFLLPLKPITVNKTMKQKLAPLAVFYVVLTSLFGSKLIYGTDVGLISHLIISLIFVYFLVIRKERKLPMEG